MSDVTPVKVGLLADYVEGEDNIDSVVLRALRMTFDEYIEAGILERPVEVVVRRGAGPPQRQLPRGPRRVLRAVNEDCVVIFGPWVSENGVPLSQYVEDLAEVPVLTMGGTESMLGEWVFALNNGSMEEEPIIMAAVAKHDGRQSVGACVRAVADRSGVPADCRRACVSAGLRITSEVGIPQVATESAPRWRSCAAANRTRCSTWGSGSGSSG